jgi:hypothetical protein
MVTLLPATRQAVAVVNPRHLPRKVTRQEAEVARKAILQVVAAVKLHRN